MGSIDNLSKPVVVVDDADLDDAGFTSSGKTKFKATLQDFSDRIFEKSVRYGDDAKGDGLDREVTHIHITEASVNVTRSFGRKKSGWSIAGQVAEYLLTGLAGVAGGNTEKSWGTPCLIITSGLVVILIVVRLNSKD